jgi:hypothetical protein
MRKRGRAAVAAPRSTAQADRTDRPRRLARGIVNEPTMGTKTVRRVMVSAFIVEGQVYFFRSRKVKVFHPKSSRFSTSYRPPGGLKFSIDFSALLLDKRCGEETPMSPDIREVENRKDRKTFIRLPAKLNAGRPDWVPPLYADERKYFDPAKNKAFGYCDVVLWLAERNGGPVGRVMGIINRRFNEHRGENIARFAYLESEKDPEIVRALLGKVEAWAREKGATRIIGPYGFTDQDPEGFLIEGFDHRATIATYYNTEWMPGFVEAEGYTKDIDYFVYKIPVPEKFPEFYLKIHDRILRKGQYTLVEFRKRREIKPYIRPVFSLMNGCYVNSNIYGYSPLDETEMDDLAKRYLPVVDPRFVKVVKKGEDLVAFIVGMPDMTAGIQKAKGKLLPFGFVHILRAAKRTKQLDLLLGGIKDPYRGLGLDVLMGVAMIRSAQQAGYAIMDTHHEMETNVKVRAEMERMGGILYKKFRVYTKAL